VHGSTTWAEDATAACVVGHRQPLGVRLNVVVAAKGGARAWPLVRPENRPRFLQTAAGAAGAIARRSEPRGSLTAKARDTGAVEAFCGNNNSPEAEMIATVDAAGTRGDVVAGMAVVLARRE
jgi:hypothetical protein